MGRIWKIEIELEIISGKGSQDGKNMKWKPH